MKNKHCSECPFRKDSMKGFLADYTPQSLHNIVMNEQHFPCHKTLPNNLLSLTPTEAEKYPRCVGPIAYMKKGCKLPYSKDLKNYMDQLPQETLDNTLSIPEFFKHHKPL